MTHNDIVLYLEAETKMNRVDFGASSITFKHDMTFFTVFRKGKKMKDVPSSVVLYNFSVEDAIIFAEAVREEAKRNQKSSQVVVSITDRLKDKAKVKQKVDEDEDSWD